MVLYLDLLLCVINSRLQLREGQSPPIILTIKIELGVVQRLQDGSRVTQYKSWPRRTSSESVHLSVKVWGGVGGRTSDDDLCIRFGTLYQRFSN